MSTLFIVATPIGNLADISPRAVDVLGNVSVIACEDTRTSSVLLQRHGITTPTLSFHQHNEHSRIRQLLDRLDAGQDVALISDAGMPGISDPGFLAVRAVLEGAPENGHRVSVIPGPDACTTALAGSGLPSDRFVFEGFLPTKKGRQTRLREIADREITTVLYESPHRISKLLNELREVGDGSRMVCVCRELTKTFEEYLRGSLDAVIEQVEQRGGLKGEIVMVVAPAGYRDQAGNGHDEHE